MKLCRSRPLQPNQVTQLIAGKYGYFAPFDPPLCHNWRVDSVEFRRGIQLFNAGQYFDSHEVLEDVWRAAPAEQKKFLQGLIQVAVALHHYGRDNLVGARSLLARAHRNLCGYPPHWQGINLAAVLTAIAESEAALARGDALPPIRLETVEDCPQRAKQDLPEETSD